MDNQKTLPCLVTIAGTARTFDAETSRLGFDRGEVVTFRGEDGPKQYEILSCRWCPSWSGKQGEGHFEVLARDAAREAAVLPTRAMVAAIRVALGHLRARSNEPERRPLGAYARKLAAEAWEED